MSEYSLAPAFGDDVDAQEDVTLVDLLDRLLAGGVDITGDITLSYVKQFMRFENYAVGGPYH